MPVGGPHRYVLVAADPVGSIQSIRTTHTSAAVDEMMAVDEYLIYIHVDMMAGNGTTSTQCEPKGMQAAQT